MGEERETAVDLIAALMWGVWHSPSGGLMTVLAVLILVALAAPAGADVTIKQTNTGQGMGMSGTMPWTTYIKGLKMRTEVMDGRR